MSVKLKIEGNLQDEIEYLQEVLYQSFPHWKFTSITKTDNPSGNHGGASTEVYFESTDSIDKGVLQQKRTVKEQYPDLIREGFATFGTEEAFFAWLMKPSFGLGGKAPIFLIAAGRKDEVHQELMRIQHGYIS